MHAWKLTPEQGLRSSTFKSILYRERAEAQSFVGATRASWEKQDVSLFRGGEMEYRLVLDSFAAQ